MGNFSQKVPQAHPRVSDKPQFIIPLQPSTLNFPLSSPLGDARGETSARGCRGEGWGSRDGSAAQMHIPSATSPHPSTPTASAYHSRSARISLRNAQYHVAKGNISLQRSALPGWGSRDGSTAKKSTRQQPHLTAPPHPNHVEGVYGIKAKPCMESATRCGMESRQGRVWNHPAGMYFPRLQITGAHKKQRATALAVAPHSSPIRERNYNLCSHSSNTRCSHQ